MPIIGYGYNQTIDPGYKANLQNIDLIAKVLLTKQNEFDTAYVGMKNLQKQALGINFINKQEQGKIDTFNKKVNDAFASGEFGDLSQHKVADRYFAMFDVIGKDTELVSRYQKDAKYQKMVTDVEAKRTSKDPAKAGFSQVHYNNFITRLNEYANLNLDSPDAESYTMRPYTNYVDLDKVIGDAMTDIPIKKWSEDTTSNGYVVTDIYEGKSPNAVMSVMGEIMASTGGPQIREQVEYTFRQAKNNPKFQQTIYAGHVAHNQSAQARIKAALDKTIADAAASKDPTQIVELAGRQARLEAELSKLKTTFKSADEFFSRDADAIIDDMATTVVQDMVASSGDTYGGYAHTRKITADRAFLEVAKMQQHAEELRIRAQIKMQSDTGDGSGNGSGDGSGGNATSSSGSSSGNSTAGEPKPSYISTSDPTHIEYADNVDAIAASLTKGYAQSTNILKAGITHGDKPMSGEDVTLSLLIDETSVIDKNQYYAGSPYSQAFKIAKDELYTQQIELAKYLDKTPTTPQEWDRLKEAAKIVQDRVEEIMAHPKNKKEADIMNQLQDINANTLALEEFMTAANASGDAADFIKKSPLIKIYPNMAYDFELPANASKEDKANQAKMEKSFRTTFENMIDVPGGVWNPEVSNVGTKEEWNAQNIDPLRARSIPFETIRKVETGLDGTIKVYFKPEVFMQDMEDGKVNPAKSGFLSAKGSYLTPLMYDKKDKKIKYHKITADEIRSIGYLELNDQKYNKLNFSNQLGFSIGVKPQKRWDASSDGVSVPFEIRKSSATGQVEVAIAGSRIFKNYQSTDVTAVINAVRSLISGAKYSDIIAAYLSTPANSADPSSAPAPAPAPNTTVATPPTQ